MRVFLTGATGFIGSRIVPELIGAGHQVLSAEEAPSHFGWLAPFAGMAMPASSAITCDRLGWTPTGPGLLEDLHAMDCAAS